MRRGQIWTPKHNGLTPAKYVSTASLLARANVWSAADLPADFCRFHTSYRNSPFKEAAHALHARKVR
jgi:hypothetical protein